MTVCGTTFEKEITQRLQELNPSRIILFGSYASNTMNDDSYIDICITKNMPQRAARPLTLHARRLIRDLIFEYKIGFDIIAIPEEVIQKRKDRFYQEEILQKGKVIYGK